MFYIVKINCGKKFPNSVWQLNLEVKPFNKTSWNEYFGLCALFVFPTGVLSIMKLWLLTLLLQNNIMKGEAKALYQKKYPAWVETLMEEPQFRAKLLSYLLLACYCGVCWFEL